MQNQIKLNERASLNRPAWTSEWKTGNFQAYKHLHIGRQYQPIIESYFEKSKELMK